MIIDDADNVRMTSEGRLLIGYSESVDGYHHAYRVTKPTGRTVVRYSRTYKHPKDPACPMCHPVRL